MKLTSQVSHCLRAFATGACLCLVGACSDSKEVRSYSIPKERETSNSPRWQAPESWEEGKSSAMRLGSYSVKDDNGSVLDVSVTAFPGDSGGSLPNVNRWLGQIGLNPIEEAKLDQYVTDTTVDDLPAHLVRADNGGKALRVLALTAKGKTWFFKLMGDTNLAEREQANFDKFIASISFSDGDDHHGHDHHEQ